jgi:osmotically-inducible protein OsmY
MQKKLAAITVLFAFLAVACGSINRVIPTDEAMKADVKGKIAEVYPTKATEIGVTVNSGVVTLSGTVDTTTQRNAIENAANSVHGVKSVIDNITIKQ